MFITVIQNTKQSSDHIKLFFTPHILFQALSILKNDKELVTFKLYLDIADLKVADPLKLRLKRFNILRSSPLCRLGKKNKLVLRTSEAIATRFNLFKGLIRR